MRLSSGDPEESDGPGAKIPNAVGTVFIYDVFFHVISGVFLSTGKRIFSHSQV